MRPDGGIREEMEAWNKRVVAEALDQGWAVGAFAQEDAGLARNGCGGDSLCLRRGDAGRAIHRASSGVGNGPAGAGPFAVPDSESPGPRAPEAAAQLAVPVQPHESCQIPEWVWQRARTGKPG